MEKNIRSKLIACCFKGMLNAFQDFFSPYMTSPQFIVLNHAINSRKQKDIYVVESTEAVLA